MASSWSPDSFKSKPALQQPTYLNAEELDATLKEISALPSLVSAKECQQLICDLAEVAEGRAFLLQGGDCAETFTDFSEDNILANFKIILQMAIVLTQGLEKPIVKVGRIAGQFAKPRSADSEKRGDRTLPSYRGDMINGLAFDEANRTPNPKRLIQTYYQSATTLNVIRSLMSDGTASLDQAHRWNEGFVERHSLAHEYQRITQSVQASLNFMRACSINPEQSSAVNRIKFYASHEALHLGYESALIRKTQVGHYIASGHFLWIGDRTRQLDGAHVELLRGIENPIGIKIGPTSNPEEIIKLISKLNPDNIAGKLTLIIRMGSELIAEKLPPIVRAIRNTGAKLIWSCDPMHGNTHTSSTGLKTRNFDRIMSEVTQFIDILVAHNVYPGGLHLEMTGSNVTECTGGVNNLTDDDLPHAYQTACDPRLNADQVLELAFKLATALKS